METQAAIYFAARHEAKYQSSILACFCWLCLRGFSHPLHTSLGEAATPCHSMPPNMLSSGGHPRDGPKGKQGSQRRKSQGKRLTRNAPLPLQGRSAKEALPHHLQDCCLFHVCKLVAVYYYYYYYYYFFFFFFLYYYYFYYFYFFLPLLSCLTISSMHANTSL